jgi:NadR type nicotinamide-nucleotide adenylyltransferase
MDAVKRIAIVGAESTGKSTLCAALAERHATVWVPEYLREFVDVHARVPHEDDQLGIAQTQRARERLLLPQARRFLFCDTSPLVTAVYSRIYWGRVPDALLALEAAHDYALTFVAGIDLPWVPDGLMRESEEVRRRVHEALLAVLDRHAIPFVLLTGDLAQRLAQVDAALGPLATA